MTGFTLAYIGSLITKSWPPYGLLITVTAATGISLFASILQWRGKLRPLLERQAQVPRRWLLWRSPVLTAGAFGFVLGAGVFTYLHHAAAYVLGAALIVAPSPSAGAALGAVYGSTWGFVLVHESLLVQRRGHRDESQDRSIYNPKMLRTLAISGIICFSLAVFVVGNS